MKHMSALKQQYRADLESLTQAYEARRKVLKDALLYYSNPTQTGAAGSGTAHNTSGGSWQGDGDSRDTSSSVGNSTAGVSKRSHRTRQDEKG